MISFVQADLGDSQQYGYAILTEHEQQEFSPWNIDLHKPLGNILNVGFKIL